ncbi:MAG: tRNA (adenosine(37)-N6)-threonylcarbamoyltransferase complex ATPase subunit type 1 TsaE [Aureispira sp.]|nr:tRNA (adenosine(37)-N6)-threonylcarbamoyltransferase complex ATPase subunit type 1 TsaE [Aureispira sp.]
MNHFLYIWGMEWHIKKLEDLDTVAQELLPTIKEYKKVVFNGEIGAGKTTLIKILCKLLGVEDATSSPTYSIINEYESAEGTVYHIDLYRLKQEQEVFDIGLVELLEEEDSYFFIEWPELVLSWMPDKVLTINVEVAEDNSRQLNLVKAI